MDFTLKELLEEQAGVKDMLQTAKAQNPDRINLGGAEDQFLQFSLPSFPLPPCYDLGLQKLPPSFWEDHLFRSVLSRFYFPAKAGQRIWKFLMLISSCRRMAA